MVKRPSKDIKKAILSVLNKEGDLTYAQLERKVNTAFVSIVDNCQELQTFGAVIISRKDKHKATGRPYFLVSITKQGRDILKKM
ncbi:MAG TPA: hypothetical protein VJH37_03770 [Candidatus Nanoarchaeia archaeon]|nr:hypothetical protein [Candidatus Nanoarchaeia archaeon]